MTNFTRQQNPADVAAQAQACKDAIRQLADSLNSAVEAVKINNPKAIHVDISNATNATASSTEGVKNK